MGLFDIIGRIGQAAPGAQALLNGDYGVYGAMQAQQARQRLAEEEAAREAELDAQIRTQAAQALQAHGYDKSVIQGMNPEDVSQLLRETYTPQNFAASGGSRMTPGRGPGQAPSFTMAPSRHEMDGRIVDLPGEGQAVERFNGNEGRIRWQTGPWGAFATDDMGRPIAPGTNIQAPGGQPLTQPAQPGTPVPPGADPAAANDIFGRMIQRESGGRQFGANGQPLRSPAGAIGIAQVMPDTAPEAARLAGLPFDRQRYMNDPQYNAALGYAYFQQQLRDFGDPALAVAAYNAGPQRVRNAVQRGGANWHSLLPRETREYVAAVMGGGGTQFAQANIPNMPGQGRSVQEQAAMGYVMAPPDTPPAQTPEQQRIDRATATIREREASVSPAQEAVDREYSERYVNWRTNEWSDVRRNIEQLRDAIGNVRNYNVTGRLLGRLPDFMVADRVVDTREQVEEVVQRNLRAILGAQFTAQEGERLISRAYNPRLDESVNALRLERLQRQMVAAAQTNESAARYYEQHGTLRGWRGRLWTISDFDPERPDPSEGRRRPAQNQGSRPNGRTRQGVRWRVVGQ